MNLDVPYLDPRTNLMDYFWYAPVAPVTLSVAAPVATQNIQIDSDADFMWIATTYQASIAGGTLTEATNVIPLVNLQITDTGSGKYLSNAPVPLGTLAGSGERPYRLIRPRKFAANSTINLNWTNFVTGATVYDITLVFHGIKVLVGARP